MRDLRPLLAAALFAAGRAASGNRAPGAAAPSQGAPGTGPSEAPTARTPEQLRRDGELSPRAAAVVDAFQNRLARFAGLLTHDRRKVVFGSNREGSPQLYLGDLAHPAAPPSRLSEGAERVQTAALTRDGKWILFTRDRGADENSHIYRVALDGAQLTDLTPGQGVRQDPPVLPLRRPDLMVYGRRTVKSPASTILVQPISGGEARVVYQDAAPTFAVDAATDQGGETSAVLALDLSAREPTAWWTAEPPGAQLDQVLASPRGGLVAVHVDAGNRSTIRLLDAKTLREKVRPDLPLGTTELGDFTPDGRTLTFSLSTPDRPGEPFALDGRSGKKRPLRADPRPGLGALAPVEVSIATIPAFDGKPIPVHVYLPKGRRNVEFPVIVEFHGGPAASSSIGWKPRTRDRTIRAFRGPNPTPSCGRCARGAGRWST